jgi:uncharacterized protein YbjT (DUF2867 family)
VRILVVGASGLIGSAVCARLAADGNTIVGAGRKRRHSRGLEPGIRIDIAKAKPQDWIGVLDGADAVVNCAGVLQDGPSNSTHGVHATGAAALFEACEACGVRRVVHFSAAGVERASSAFSESKLAGDAALMATGLDWFILRPSVVIGRAAYGGSALFRGLAALPVMPVIEPTGPLQLVNLDDVVETVAICLRPETSVRQMFELVGPRRCSFADTVQLFRRWLGWQPAPVLHLPPWCGSLIYRAGDAVGWLGWNPPIRTTVRREIGYGAVGDPTTWMRLTGISPQDIETALAREPASVQERWFARMYFLKPLLFTIFPAFWIGTGLVSLGPGWDIGTGLVREGGATVTVAAAAVTLGAVADILIGLLICVRRTSRIGLFAALSISVAYAVIGTILVPRLWHDPLGPMLKIWPIMVLNLIALAILEDR